MPASHKGTVTVLSHALPLCAFLAASELALAQTCTSTTPPPTITLDVCASCTLQTLYAAHESIKAREGSLVVNSPYTIRLTGAVKVGGPLPCDATASNCGVENWSWNVSGNTASCPVIIDALDSTSKPTLLRNTTQSPKTDYVLSGSQAL
jgi:hypothetical protein